MEIPQKIHISEQQLTNAKNYLRAQHLPFIWFMYFKNFSLWVTQTIIKLIRKISLINIDLKLVFSFHLFSKFFWCFLPTHYNTWVWCSVSIVSQFLFHLNLNEKNLLEMVNLQFNVKTIIWFFFIGTSCNILKITYGILNNI